MKRRILLGDGQALPFKQNDAGLTVTLPASKPGLYAHALKIEGLKLQTPAGH